MKKYKINKIIMLTVILSMIFAMTADAVVFTDISDHWAKSYIERVAEKELVSGYDDKTFKPDNNVTVLEALVMLSRLYDIDDDVRDEIIDKYKPVLKKMPNTLYREWSFEYLSVIMELGVVSESLVENWFSNKAIFQDATREEIAVLLTKTMMLEDEVKSLKVYALPFSDRDQISVSARPYIYVMYDKEILQGDAKKNINPKNNITRAEISTLLDKAYTYIEENDVYPDLDDYKPTTVVSGMITKLSQEKTESYIYIKNDKQVESIIKVNNDTEIYVNGRTRLFSDLKEDMIVECKIDENRVALEIEADSTKEVVRGIIAFVAFSQPSSITIYDEDDDKVKYDVPSDIDIYHEGKITPLKNLKEKDEVMLLLDDNKVYQINSYSRIKHYDGEITSIDYTAYPIKISIKTEAGETKTFIYNNDVEVERNEEESSFDRVRAGDEVTITTSYDKMIRINTTAKEAESNGTIKEILIGSVIKLKIADKDGDIEQYSVSNNASIIIGDKNASVYDLRLGYKVNINTFGEEIVSIEASELQTALNFTGKVLYLNVDDKVIMMQNVNSGGKTELIYLKVTNNTKIFNTSGSNKYIKDIVEGESILATAISQGGEYVAVSIMIQ